MTVSIENLVARNDGGCIIVESRNQDPQIEAFKNTVSPLAEEFGGGTQVDADGAMHDLSAIKGDSSRKLAPGELFCRSITGMPVDLHTADDATKILVTLPSGITAQLSELMKLGAVTISDDGIVRSRAVLAPPKAAPPAQPLSLGMMWDKHRAENRSADGALLSLMNAVTMGKQGATLDNALDQFNEKLNLKANSRGEVKEVYNQLTKNAISSMGEQLRQALPGEVGSNGKEFVEALLKIVHPSDRVNLMNQAIHGDKGWVKRAIQILRREARLKS
jgi:hypothetical protein